MPVLIAGVQALLDPKTRFGTYKVSTGSWSPFWLINGPIRNALNVNHGTGALSPGHMANAAIGRTMGFIIKNIGGARKGVEDMGTLGNPGKCSMVADENEEDSPWEPLHVEQGLSRSDSAVSVSFPNCYATIQPYLIDDNGILRAVVSNIIPGMPREGKCSVLVPPRHAKTLADKGWTQKDIAAFVSEFARVPAYHHPGFYSPAGRLLAITEEHTPCVNSMDSVSILDNPDYIRVIVVGGPGAFVGLVQGGGPGKPTGALWVTRKVELPANWESLVQKYKGIVPTYVRY